MLQRFLSFTSTALLCLGSSTAFAQTDPSGTDTRLDEAPTLEEHRTAADTRRPLQSADRADADRLPRVAKITFDHPFGADQTLASFSSSRTYSFDRTGRLHVVDMQTGEALGSTLLGSRYRHVEITELSESKARVIGAESWSRDQRHLRVYDVSIGDGVVESTVLHEVPTCGPNIHLLSDSDWVLNFDRCTQLVDVATGEHLFYFPNSVDSVVDGWIDDARWLFFGRRARGGEYQLEAWQLESPTAIAQKWTRTVGSYLGIRLARHGEVLVVPAADGPHLELLDPLNGRKLSTIATEGSLGNTGWVEGGGKRVLAISAVDSVELWDVVDSTAPRRVATVPLGAQVGTLAFGKPSLLASPDRPWLAVLIKDPNGVALIDAERGILLGRHEDGPHFSRHATWSTLADGSPAVIMASGVTAQSRIPNPSGGLWRLDTISFADPGVPTLALRHAPVTPGEVEAVLPIAGRYAIAVDRESNAYVLVDLATSTVLDATGTEGALRSSNAGFLPFPAAAAGSRVAVGEFGTGFQIFEVDIDAGRILHRGFRGIDATLGRPGLLGALTDGTIVVNWSGGFLTTHLPDGRRGELELPFRADGLTVSPAGDRAVFTYASVWAGPGGSSYAVDLRNPAEPSLLWETANGAQYADFVRGGDLLAITRRVGRDYAPFLVDPDTGEIVSEPVDSATPWFYYAPTVAYGDGSGSRLKYWHWTFSGWQTVVFDVGSDAPRIVRRTDEYFVEPEALARDDGTSAYEFRTSTLLVDADGTFVHFDDVTLCSAERLRHGFLVGYDDVERCWLPGQSVSVRRDIELNRPPVGVIGGNFAVECASLDGTVVPLDADESSDRDSWPGTDSDLASFFWSVDGDPAGFGAEIAPELIRGAHTVELTVTDVLGATGATATSVEVVDTTAPEVAVSLRPSFRDRVWSFEWAIDASASDTCDGELPPDVQVELDPALAALEPRLVTAPRAFIEILAGPRGPAVRVAGPDPDRVLASWQAALTAGGLVPSGSELTVPPIGGRDREVVVRYLLDETGAVEAIQRSAGAGDVTITASAVDSAGLGADTRVSLRETVEALCASLPSSAICAAY